MFKAELQKKKRDTYDYCNDEKVYIAKWHDNSIVNAPSNWETRVPVRKIRRRIKAGAKEVTQPHLIGLYNKGMYGFDLMDRLLESYCPTINEKNGTGPCL